ncbi:unnamed protein product [Orchesella dallaii]|uniref:Gustatory receptor n=1 Tax=Orchesella dallaii TaxID=48710 RepID=A0ABP1R615_9HEXA
MGIFPSFLMKNGFLKLLIIIWNTFTFLFNLLWWLLDLYRLKEGLSNNYIKAAGGVLVNASLGIASIQTMTFLLAVRTWIFVCDLLEIYHGSLGSFTRIISNFKKFFKTYKGMESAYLARMSLNELIFFMIVLFSLARHFLMVNMQEPFFFFAKYEPEPNIWSLKFEFRMRYGKALLLDVSPLDSLGLLCAILLRGMEMCVAYLNDRIELNLIELEEENFPNNFQNHYEYSRKGKKKGQEVLFQHLVLMEYRRLNKFGVKDICQLYQDLVGAWKHLKKAVEKLIFVCFGLWMQNLCFNCFFSYTASIDVGPLTLFTFTFHFIVITTVLKYICMANACHGMNSQIERLNNLLLRVLASWSSSDAQDDDGDNQGNSSWHFQVNKRRKKKHLNITSKDVSSISHLYDLNSKERLLNLSVCGYLTFNRETVLAVSGLLRFVNNNNI